MARLLSRQVPKVFLGLGTSVSRPTGALSVETSGVNAVAKTDSRSDLEEVSMTPKRSGGRTNADHANIRWNPRS